MKRNNVLKKLVLLGVLAGSAMGANAAITLEDLRCEFMVNPVGINAESPRLSWKIKSDAQGEKQTALEIIAASSPDLLTPDKADLWSSGKIESDWSHLFPYVGKKPAGMEYVFWKVRVWDKDGKASAWSDMASFSFGPDEESDWKNSQWIGAADSFLNIPRPQSSEIFFDNAKWIWTSENKADKPENALPAGSRYFGKDFTFAKGKTLDSLYILATADDSYELYLNGEKVGNGSSWEVLDAYEAKKYTCDGVNQLRAVATNGAKGYAGFALVMVAGYTDGSKQLFSTDSSWKCAQNADNKWMNSNIEGWGDAKVLGKVGIDPWKKLEPKAILPNPPAILLRKDFTLADKEIRCATAHISGLGLFELYLNGEKIGDHVLDAMCTDYTKTVAYQSFDVTKNLTSGANAVGVQLGNGRFVNPRVGKHYGLPMTRALIRVMYTDGSIQDVITDETWTATSDGPIRYNNEFDGETYDARMEIPGWNVAGFDASAWASVKKVAEKDIPAGKLKAQMMPPIRVTEILTPKSVKRTQRGTYMVDMGQNMVGWCRIKVNGPAGTTIKMVHAETLRPDGTLYMENLRSAKVTDRYTLKGGTGTEVYEPRFIYHGFRFVEVYDYPGVLTVDDICGCEVHDDLDVIGQFETSNQLVNQIYHNIFWGTRDNYRSMPTDCPQRDERLGWLGDRACGSRGEGLMFNHGPLYAKWLRDMADSQEEDGSISDVSPNYWEIYRDNVTWPSASVIIPMALYDEYGDLGIIAEHYPSMKKWMDLIQTYVKEDGVVPIDTYGDWCCPPESPELIHSADPLRKTAGPVLSTTYFYGNLRLMEQYANLLGKKEDAAIWAKRADDMKTAFIAKFYNKEKKCFDNGSQTSSVLPLFFGMVPEGEEDAVFNQLVNKIMINTKGHTGVGLVGAQYLNRTLSDYGRDDIAWQFLQHTDYPSFGYMVKKGATTVWELWNGDTANPAMNSHNHVMLVGDLVCWFYERLAGIRNVAPGYKEILIKPCPVQGCDFVNASIETPYGKAASSWTLEGKKFHLDIEIPANTTATVVLPDGKSTKVGSGKYSFDCEDAFPNIQTNDTKITSTADSNTTSSTLTPFGPFTTQYSIKNGKLTANVVVPARSQATVTLPNGDKMTFNEGSYQFERPLK